MLLILSGLYFCVDGKADEVEENDEDDDSSLYNLITNIHCINPSGNTLLCDFLFLFVSQIFVPLEFASSLFVCCDNTIDAGKSCIAQGTYRCA